MAFEIIENNGSEPVMFEDGANGGAKGSARCKRNIRLLCTLLLSAEVAVEELVLFL
jgi:hypothetical protein